MTTLGRACAQVVAALMGAAMTVGASRAAAQAQAERDLSCLPDRVVAAPGDKVALSVWTAVPEAPMDARWNVSAGRVETQAPTTTWVLEGVPVDQRQTAAVDVHVDGARVGTCSVGVWVAPAETNPGNPGQEIRLRGEYITRRAFLRGGQVGEAGFGLYTYFLMREPATPPDAARNTAFVTAFLDVLVGIADQENYVERRRLNGSYLPVTRDVPSGLSASQRADWALEHYDYEQAGRLLSLYPMLTGPGPFIVAVPAPLRSPVKPMLPWDFSQAEGAAIVEGIRRFLNQAAQLYEWQNQSALPILRDRLLTAVAGLFVGRAAAERWIQVVP